MNMYPIFCTQPHTLQRAFEYAREDMEIDAIVVSNSCLDNNDGAPSSFALSHYVATRQIYCELRDLWMGSV